MRPTESTVRVVSMVSGLAVELEMGCSRPGWLTTRRPASGYANTRWSPLGTVPCAPERIAAGRVIDATLPWAS